MPIPYLGRIWPDVAELIDGVVADSAGRWSVEVIARQFLSGNWQLWVVWNGKQIVAAVGTELYVEDTGLKLARVVVTTGTGAYAWAHLISDLEDWARSQDAVRLELVARKGWTEYLLPLGYRARAIVFDKEL